MRKRKLTEEEILEREKLKLEKLKTAKYCPKKPGCCWAYNPKVKPKRVEE